MFDKKIFVPIIIIIIVISGAIYYWQLMKTDNVGEEQGLSEQNINEEEKDQDEIINWETYRNLAYAFEIKYPESWEVTTTEMKRGFKIEINNTNAPCSVLTISAFPNNSERLSIKEYHTKNYGWGSMYEKLVTFNGIEGVRVHTDWISTMCKSDSISFIEGVFVYDIDIVWSDSTDEKILEDIFHSFNFNSENLKAINKARDAKIITAISQIRTIMNQVYMSDNNYNNFDLDNEDISRFDLVDQVIKNGGNLIFSSESSTHNSNNIDKTCIYSDLTGDHRWYCADSAGQAGFCDGLENDPSTTCRTYGASAYCPSSCE